MEVRVVEQEGRDQIEVEVLCPPSSSQANRLAEKIRAAAGKILGYRDKSSISKLAIPLDEVMYIEAGEKKAWICTGGGKRYESPLKFYELEELLDDLDFIRVSRQVLVNFGMVDEIRPEPNGRMTLVLKDGKNGGDKREYVCVNRSYSTDVKDKLNGII